MPGDTWVCCDECGKWRRMAQELANSLDEDAKWYCKDNPDPLFNSCEIQQELTDVEIDEHAALLAEEEAKALEATTATPKSAPISAPEVALRSSKFRKRPSIWQVINKNIYTHRERKRQDEDEIMICQCPPIWATDTTTIGCGEHCLNRMLNIECVSKYCPCGERCTNQAFSKRQYAKLDVKRAGAKGFGLYAAENIKAGQFIIEYVGEVLEEDEYIRRKEFYVATGQRHYYFMNVGNGEVIDATRRGGMGRFINHSCQPNCETQKWVVRGEIAIGLYALEDIPAGEELTFDYNFERYGDKPMKCLCGSVGCRGVIGGVQETVLKAVEAIVVPEEDNEPEPIMITEKEADNALTAILDRAVGLGWEKGFDEKLQKRLEKLTMQKGLSIASSGDGGVDEDEDEEEGEYGDEEEEDEDDGEDDEDFAAAARHAAAAAAAIGRKKPKKKPPTKTKQRARRARNADPDWGVAAQSNKTTTAVVSDDDDGAAVLHSPASTASLGQQRSTAPIPKRSSSIAALASSSSRWRTGPARRSEVDRRIDSMITASGRLRDFDSNTVVKLLRLFNLCDISPTISKTVVDDDGNSKDKKTVVASASGGAVDNTNTNNTITNTNNTAVHHHAGSNGDVAAREEGEMDEDTTTINEIIPPPPPPPLPSTSSIDNNNNNKPDDNTTNTNTNTMTLTNNDEGSSQPRSRIPAARRYEDLTPRQRARLADLSLLLDVILKTTARTAQQEFLRCGILRQLLVCIGHNTSEAFAVVLRKVLQVVDGLPATSDDIYNTRSAHGSFGDFLRELTPHRDYEVRAKAWALLKKFPINSCTRPPVGESMHSAAASAQWTPRPVYGGSGGIVPGSNSGGYSSERPPMRGGYYGSPSPGPIRGMPLGRRGGGRGGGGDQYYNGPSRFHSGGGRFSSSFSGRGGSSTWTPQSSSGPSPHSRYNINNNNNTTVSNNGSGSAMGRASSLSRFDDDNGAATTIGKKRSRWDMSAPEPPSHHRDHRDDHHSNGNDHHHGKHPRNGVMDGDTNGGSHPHPHTHAATTEHNAAVPSSHAIGSGALPPTFSPISDDEDDNTNNNNDDDATIDNGRLNNGTNTTTTTNAFLDDDDDDDLPSTYDGDTSWNVPDESFEAFVADIVRRRVGKYEQPNHPARLSRDEAAKLFRKIRRSVIAREHEAFEARRKARLFKPIERGKLEARIKAYVRDSVHRYHTQNG